MIDDQTSFPNVVVGEGYSAAHLDDLGEGYGFRRVRRGLGIEAFGANAIVLPPRYEAGAHLHEQQEELYFVHTGQIEMEFGDGSVITLGPGSLVRVDASTVRRLRNFGTEDATILAIGGKGGYVGRDGKLPEGEVREGGPLDG